jgi:acetyltransferase-like isoleucine patch superfamily enzyme
MAAELPRRSGSAGRWLKGSLNAFALAAMAPGASTVWLGRRLGGEAGRLGVFTFWAHLLAQIPGAPGRFLRRGFYRWTLEQCASDVTIEFGTIFSRPSVRLEEGVYIGTYALIGSAHIGHHSLVGSRTSLLSGGHQHRWLPTGRWSETEASSLVRISIGPHSWIGEGAILTAGTGEGCMVAAGTVVSATVPAHTMVAGNPARFVRRITGDDATTSGG